MARETQYFNGSETQSNGLDGQTAMMRFNAQVDTYGFAKPDKRFISVTLNGTSVEASTSGALAISRLDLRGWFTELVEVKINLSPVGFAVEQDAPQTTMGAAVTTSTTSISVNESLGTFGPTPTTNIGAGVTIGSSFSRNMTDFRIANISDNAGVNHHYALSSSNGAAYNEPKDLLDMSAGGQFQGTPLFTVPDIAVANLPIISQAVFIADGGVPDTLNLGVTIVHHLRKVEKTFKLFVTDVQTWSHTWSHTWNGQVHIPAVN